MDIPSQYSMTHRVDSFSAYVTPRFYQNSSIIKTSKNPITFKSRQTFVADIQKLSQQIPGPGKYSANPEQQKIIIKNKSKKTIQKQEKKGGSLEKYTFLNDVQKNAKKIPQVGRYNIGIDNTEQIIQKYKKKGDKDRKNAPLFRPTALDQANVDTVRVAPGNYEVQKPIGYKSLLGSISPQQKHNRTLSLPKLPGAGDYTPVPVSYQTFLRKQSLKSLKNKKKNRQPQKQSKKLQTLGPGPKYSLIIDWALEKGKDGKVKGQNYLKRLHLPSQPGIYH